MVIYIAYIVNIDTISSRYRHHIAYTDLGSISLSILSILSLSTRYWHDIDTTLRILILGQYPCLYCRYCRYRHNIAYTDLGSISLSILSILSISTRYWHDIDTTLLTLILGQYSCLYCLYCQYRHDIDTISCQYWQYRQCRSPHSPSIRACNVAVYTVDIDTILTPHCIQYTYLVAVNDISNVDNMGSISWLYCDVCNVGNMENYIDLGHEWKI